jgi:hypothetical protein
MEHLHGEMLSSRVVDGDTSIDTARDQEVPLWGISKLGKRLVELTEFICYTSSLNIEDSHDT